MKMGPSGLESKVKSSLMHNMELIINGPPDLVAVREVETKHKFGDRP